MLAEHGTTLVPTLMASAMLLEDGPSEHAPAVRNDDGRSSTGTATSCDARSGPAYPSSSAPDSGATPHGRNLEELALMEQCGMAPLDVLRAATSGAAELLGIGAEAGTIEVGKVADLVVVEGDPLALADLPGRVRARDPARTAGQRGLARGRDSTDQATA